MNITMLALGSLGDVLPIAALGQALSRGGHRVSLATFAGYESIAASRGLAFYPVSGNAEAILGSSSGLSLAESGRNLAKAFFSVMRSFGSIAEDYASGFSQLMSLETDVIINQLPAGLFGFDLAEKLKVPMVSAAVMPLTRTNEFPAMGMPRLGRIRAYNRWSYRVLELGVWLGFRRTVNRWRRSVLGLSPAPLLGYAGELYHRSTPVLNGFSRHVVARPGDWGDHVHVTGYWFPEDATWQPPRGLLAFLEAGAEPLFIGFGSMPMRDPEAVKRTVLQAVRDTGRRAVVHAGWGGLAASLDPGTIFPLEYAPYSWLFPRISAAVLHGGSGSTAFCLRAGKPAILVPFLFDQFYWGERVSALNVGPGAIPFKSLTAARLAKAIDTSLTDRKMRDSAAGLGQLIRQENGLSEAVRIINDLRS